MRPFLLTALLLLSLAGCSAAGDGSSSALPAYALTPPSNPGGRMCTLQCGEAQEYCRESCGYTHRQCVNDAQAAGMRYYEAYTKEQFAANQPIELRPRDFERATGCDAANDSCRENCASDYRLCFGNCGGKVEAR